PANTFQVTPAGKVYFLSNQSGKIDVVKTDLDGGNRQVVLPGSGSEDLGNTILLASRDWKYLALLSKRDGGDNAKLFLIDTSNDQTTNIDEGNASFTPIGWYDDSFVYLVNRTSYSSWQPKATSTKSFDAANKRLLVLDNTNATGSSNADAQYENIFAYSFAKDQLVYAKTWYRYPGYTDVAGQQNTLNTIKADGSDKKTLKSVDAATQYFGSLQLTKPNNLEVQVSTNGGGPTTYFTYDGTSLSPDTTLTDNTFYNTNVITYLLSPSEKQTFWSEPRDGKNTLFVGDVNGAGAKQVVAQSDYQTFGWYTDNYLLLSKGGSELYILPVDGSGTPLKISNYYKPERLFNGYGGGYGGL
ncbi:MAG TPA: hypothetical protein VKQ34_00705, partial [Candidatus Saccharimonadales bacterium]|nr:hypothetical protein [Candidatus Saccharimonadales bacterium]